MITLRLVATISQSAPVPSLRHRLHTKNVEIVELCAGDLNATRADELGLTEIPMKAPLHSLEKTTRILIIDCSAPHITAVTTALEEHRANMIALAIRPCSSSVRSKTSPAVTGSLVLDHLAYTRLLDDLFYAHYHCYYRLGPRSYKEYDYAYRYGVSWATYIASTQRDIDEAQQIAAKGWDSPRRGRWKYFQRAFFFGYNIAA